MRIQTAEMNTCLIGTTSEKGSIDRHPKDAAWKNHKPYSIVPDACYLKHKGVFAHRCARYCFNLIPEEVIS